MSDWVECFRGVVYPADCDHLGHMNVKSYTGMFDQAAFHLHHGLGLGLSGLRERGEMIVDAQHTVRFLKEQLVGALIVIDGALTRIGTKSFVCTYRMRNLETGDIAATSEIVSVYFSERTRASAEIPSDLRRQLEPALVSADL